MGKAITSYDIQIRLAYISKAMSSYSNDLMLKKKLGADCKESECKLKLLGVYQEILSCYKDPCSTTVYECFTEEELQNVFNLITRLTGYCFPPTGLARSTNTCIPSPSIIPTTHKELCTNPIQALINDVNNGGNLSRILDEGMLLSKSIYCCPTCGIYSFSDVDEFLKLAEAIGISGIEDPLYECTNLTTRSSIDTYLKLAEAITLENYTSIYTSEVYMERFINNLSSTDKAEINTLGIVEFGKFTNYITTKLILNNFTSDQIKDIILVKGITVICTETHVVLGSIEAVLKYIQSET